MLHARHLHVRMCVHVYFERREWHTTVRRVPGEQHRRHHIHSTERALTARTFSTTACTEGPSMRQTSSAFLWELSVQVFPVQARPEGGGPRDRVVLSKTCWRLLDGEPPHDCNSLSLMASKKYEVHAWGFDNRSRIVATPHTLCMLPALRAPGLPHTPSLPPAVGWPPHMEPHPPTRGLCSIQCYWSVVESFTRALLESFT